MNFGRRTADSLGVRSIAQDYNLVPNGSDSSVIEGEGPERLDRNRRAKDYPMLIFRGGPLHGATVPIFKSVFTLGCLPENDVVISGPGVSHRHAEITLGESGFTMRALEASNRIVINDADIGEVEHHLCHGDHIRLGNSEVAHVFSYGGDVPFVQAEPPHVPTTLETGRDNATPATADAEPDQLPEVQPHAVEPPAEDAVQHETVSETSHLQDVYEGTVRLRVESKGNIPVMVSFVASLRHNPMIRVLRLVSNPPKEANIWLALREPVALSTMLGEMEEVSGASLAARPDVGASDDEPAVLEVQLNSDYRRG